MSVTTPQNFSSHLQHKLATYLSQKCKRGELKIYTYEQVRRDHALPTTVTMGEKALFLRINNHYKELNFNLIALTATVLLKRDFAKFVKNNSSNLLVGAIAATAALYFAPGGICAKAAVTVAGSLSFGYYWVKH